MPVWLLLAPRDYLSTFVKLGTIAMLALGIVALRPTLHMPALTRFIDGTGPGVCRKHLSLCVHHHRLRRHQRLPFPDLQRHDAEADLVARRKPAWSATAPWSPSRWSRSWPLIAACVLQPGIYFAINSPAGIVGQAPGSGRRHDLRIGDFRCPLPDMHALAHAVGEQTLFNRTGGAPAFAVGMAHIFSNSLGGQALMAIWYHFAIMFEALFILTVLDAGTRVGRFMVQDALGHIWKPWAEPVGIPAFSPPAR